MSADPYAPPAAHAPLPSQRRFDRAQTALATAWMLATLAVVAWTIFLSLDRDRYFFYNDAQRAAWSYHPVPVAITCVAIAIEAGLLAAVWFSSAWRRAWLRAFAALGLLGPWAVLVSLAIVHMPVYTFVHVAWVWLVVAASAVTLIVDLILAAVRLARAS